MKIGVNRGLSIGLSSLPLLALLGCTAILAGAAVAHGETTVLDMANQQRAETVSAAQNPAATVTAANNAPKTLPIINSPSINAPTAAAAPSSPTVAAPVVAAPASPEAAVPTPAVAAVAPASAVIQLDNPTRTQNEQDVPPQVQGVIEKLRGAKVDLSLEDMNQARAALARLDLLLSLEQKMHDLQAARQKHDAAANAEDISGFLPTQVSGNMGMAGNAGRSPKWQKVGGNNPMNMNNSKSKRDRAEAEPASYDLQRVVGVNGNYTAMVMDNNAGKVSSVRVGDKIGDNGLILAITPQMVRLRDEDGRVQRLTIDNMSAMSGGPKVQ